MATVNSASLRDEFEAYKADIASLRKEGKISKEADVVFRDVSSVGNHGCHLPRKDDQKDQ